MGILEATVRFNPDYKSRSGAYMREATARVSKYVNVTVNNKNLILSNELIKVDLPPWKFKKADASRVSPSSEPMTKGQRSKRQLSNVYQLVW